MENGIQIEDLSQALNVFNRTTFQLQDYYVKLEQKVKKLSEELECKNSELNQKVNQIDQIRGYLNNVLESISDGVVAVNLKGIITTCNQSACSLLKKEYKNILGQNVENVFAKKKLFSIVSEGVKLHINQSGLETNLVIDSESTLPVVLYASKIFDEKQDVIGVVFTFKDLSLIKRLEDEVERAHRLASVGEMAAGVAHEIRNPLGGIEMFASILEKEVANNGSLAPMVSNILEGTRRINKIVSELLNFTRSLNHTDFTEMDLVDVIESSLAFAELEFKQNQVSVVQDYQEEGSFVINGDQDQLKQLFLNLFLNSSCAMQEKGGILTITLQRETDNAVVTVRDTGKGIAQEHLKKVFDPFFTTRPDGNGLGLSISYRIVEAHKGHIQVDRKIGQGTAFKISFPITQI